MKQVQDLAAKVHISEKSYAFNSLLENNYFSKTALTKLAENN